MKKGFDPIGNLDNTELFFGEYLGFTTVRESDTKLEIKLEGVLKLFPYYSKQEITDADLSENFIINEDNYLYYKKIADETEIKQRTIKGIQALTPQEIFIFCAFGGQKCIFEANLPADNLLLESGCESDIYKMQLCGQIPKKILRYITYFMSVGEKGNIKKRYNKIYRFEVDEIEKFLRDNNRKFMPYSICRRRL